jgi:hypothetical protein
LFTSQTRLTLGQIAARLDGIHARLATTGDVCYDAPIVPAIREVERELLDLRNLVLDAKAEEDMFEAEFERGFEEAKEASLQAYLEREHEIVEPEHDDWDDACAAADLANDEAGYEAQPH